jgi:hypothetical protein
MMKMYTDAGVIGVRPHHPQFMRALTILEDTAAAFLTHQIKLDESLKQAQDRLAQLAYSIERKPLLAGTLKARI